MKSFIKAFSIYGLIPVFGKFIGILLLPMYTRLLSPEDYGAQDILIQITMFMTFLINLEMYNGVGRNFYERKGIRERRALVSTGIWVTALFAVIVVSTVLLMGHSIYGLFFDNDTYFRAYDLAMIWAPLSSLYTFLIVIMRYEKKPRLYFTLINIQLVLRIVSSVVCVAVLKMGVSGVILGHIIGEAAGALMFGITLRKYIGFSYRMSDFKSIAMFSLPLVPAVLIISFKNPLIRFLVANLLSVSDMGYYTIALQMASLLSFVQYGLRMSWHPYLYEMILKPRYEVEVRRIYNLFLGILSIVSVIIILNGSLLLRVLTTPAYFPARSIIGFVVVFNMLDIIRQISGCGPVVAKRTMYNTYYEFAATATSVAAFLVLHRHIGIVGLAVSFLAGNLIKFVWSWHLTRRMTNIRLAATPTVLIMGLLVILSTLYAMIDVNLYFSLALSLILFIAFCYWQKDKLRIVFRHADTRIKALRG